VSWQSRMQTSVELSSMESEYMAASAAAQEAIWLNRLLEELGFCMPKPIKLHEDNKAEILFSDHPGDHRRLKHIDTRKYFIREAVINGVIKLEYTPTLDQLADELTKALPPDHHMKCFREPLSSYQMPDHKCASLICLLVYILVNVLDCMHVCEVYNIILLMYYDVIQYI
jgi:hypothetical protein